MEALFAPRNPWQGPWKFTRMTEFLVWMSGGGIDGYAAFWVGVVLLNHMFLGLL